MNGRLISVRAGGAEFLLGLFAGFLEALQGHGIFAEIDAVFFFEFVGDVVDEDLVEIVAAEVRVAVGADDLEHAVGDFEDGDVERAAAEIEHDDLFVLFAIQAVGQGRGGGFVDDAGDFEAGDLAGVFGGLTLGIVEVGRHGDDGFVYFVAEVGFGGFLQLAEDAGGDFGGRVFFVADFDFHVVFGAADDLVGDDLFFAGHFAVAAAHEALDRVDGFLGVGDGLTAGELADQDIAFVGEGHDAGREAVAFLIGDDLGFFALHHCDDGVGGAEIDADDFFAGSHEQLLVISACGWRPSMGQRLPV